VKIALSFLLRSLPDSAFEIPQISEAEANLQNAGIMVEEKVMLPVKYDCIYLNFINQPDPASLAFACKKLDLENPDLLMDKSEDAYLEKNSKLNTSPGKLR
jgi:hypothetical protein